MTWYLGTGFQLPSIGVTATTTYIGIFQGDPWTPDAVAVGFRFNIESDTILDGLLVTLQDTNFSGTELNQLNGRSFSNVLQSYAPDFDTGGLIENVLVDISQRSADVPVPATLALLGLGLVGLGAARRKQA